MTDDKRWALWWAWAAIIKPDGVEYFGVTTPKADALTQWSEYIDDWDTRREKAEDRIDQLRLRPLPLPRRYTESYGQAEDE